MANSKFYIYVLFRETGVPFYVGKGNGRRWLEHARGWDRRNTHKNATVRKMLAAGHDIPMIKLHEGLTEDVAFAYEKALIAAIGRHDRGLGPLTNLTDGGDGVSGALNISRSAETRAKLAAVQRGRRHSAEARAKMSAAKLGNKTSLGRKASVETRTKIAAAKMGNKFRLGHKHTPETRAKISATKRGVRLSVKAMTH